MPVHTRPAIGLSFGAVPPDVPPDAPPGLGGRGVAGLRALARSWSAAAGRPPAGGRYSRHVWPLLAAGSGLALVTAAVPGYWRTTWWALCCVTVLGVGSAVSAVVVARRGLPAKAIMPLVLLADGAVVAAAPCVRDVHRAGPTIVLFVVPTLIVALFGTARLLAGQVTAVASGAAVVLHLGGDPVPVLVLHDLLALLGTFSPAVTVLALRHHLEATVQLERRLATTDQLTAATNRWGMDAAVTRVAGLAAGRELPVGVMVADVDHFKRINDEYGHPVGDEVLRRVAEAMRACIRVEDHLIRLGGEEFAVLAVLGPRALTGLAERLRRHVQARCAAWQLTVSVGVAWGDVDIAGTGTGLGGAGTGFGGAGTGFGGAGTGLGGAGTGALSAAEECVVEQVWELIGFADAALLEAKRAGRNRVRIAASGPEGGVVRDSSGGGAPVDVTGGAPVDVTGGAPVDVTGG